MMAKIIEDECSGGKKNRAVNQDRVYFRDEVLKRVMKEVSFQRQV